MSVAWASGGRSQNKLTCDLSIVITFERRGPDNIYMITSHRTWMRLGMRHTTGGPGNTMGSSITRPAHIDLSTIMHIGTQAKASSYAIPTRTYHKKCRLHRLWEVLSHDTFFGKYEYSVQNPCTHINKNSNTHR